MTDSENYHLDDGTTVRFLLADAGQPAFGDDGSADGLGPVIPVGRRGAAVAAVAANALRGTLRPLGPLVQEVHDAVSAVPTPPTEIAVTFGVQLSQDLKLGIVNGNGQAHLTVTATWSPATASPAPRADDHQPTGALS
ncbi:CU044_2847 family protein [Streptomyces sp. PSRA5]|uniref:CU044_2847 family protein n=1 Tax=Streptomyces panacea TaxID=3035064 RepID=UPI00339BB567